MRVEQVGELGHLEGVDLLQRGLLGGVAAVVRDAVVVARDAQEGEAARVEGVLLHEGRHPGDVALEGEHDQVRQQLEVLLVAAGVALGRARARVAGGGGGRGPRPARHLEVDDPPLQLAHRGQVLVELGPIAAAQPAVEAGGVAADHVEDALAVDELLVRRAGGWAPGARRAGAVAWAGRAPAPANSRFHSARGLTSLGMKVVGLLQEMLCR